MNIVIIIQARMGSTRLPGKMMLDLNGRPVVQRVVERARLSKLAHAVWLATSTGHADDVLADWAGEHDVPCYRGSEDDVLDRYYKTAVQAGGDIIVRVTGDCPVIDPEIVDAVIQAFQEGEFDYVSNTQPPTFPDGLDVEVVSFAALERAWKEAKLHSEREHVMPYIWKHPELFRLKNVVNKEDLSSYRWTLDTREDYEFLQHLVEDCDNRDDLCGMNQMLSIVLAHPEWKELNAMYERNEGYKKSVAEET